MSRDTYIRLYRWDNSGRLVNFRLTEKDFAQLEAYAKAEGISKQGAMLEMVRSLPPTEVSREKFHKRMYPMNT